MTKKIYKTIFSLDEKTKITIKYNSDFSCCDEAPIILVQHKKKIILTRDFLYHNMTQFIGILKKTLANTLQLHDSFTQNIGFLFNQYSAHICGKKLKEPTYLTYTPENNKPYWPENGYHVWAQNDFITWMYNDKNGNIMFEITPFYPYMYSERKKEQNYISYNKWIKTYKPYVIRTIPKKTAQKWLNQAEHIIKTIEENIRKWEEEQKKKNL